MVLDDTANFVKRPQCQFPVDRFNLFPPKWTLIIKSECQRPFDNWQFDCPGLRRIFASERTDIEDVLNNLYIQIDPLEIPG